jgi:3-oxoacyl-[acyl-carrier protein] reductase
MKDKVVLITGGATGIGRATALRFTEGGAKHVAIFDVNEELGKATAVDISGEFFKVDVSNRADVQAGVDKVIERYGHIDVLINNAGITRDGLFVKFVDGQLEKQMSETDFDRVIDVNLKGCFNCAQAVAPYMIKQKGGVILNASSVVGLDGNYGQANYVAAKSGLIGLTNVLARELGKYNIRVNAVCPGFTATEMVLSMPDRILESMKAKTPLGRLADPSDIANAYFFLASDQAEFITNAVLRVDGGIQVGT